MSEDVESQCVWTDLYDSDGELIGMVQEDRLHILHDEQDYPIYIIPSIKLNIPPENCYIYAKSI